MKIAWFATFRAEGDAAVTDDEHRRVCDIVAATPGLTKGLVYTPWDLSDLYFDDGPSPQLQLELCFDDIAALEDAVGEGGHLQVLAGPGTLPSLAGAHVTEQAMLARPFPVPDPAFRTPEGQPHCTYLVHYPGLAENLNEWLRFYITSHTGIMAKFPGIRQIEICSRIDWCSALPWQRVHYMQRNKVVFDDGEALKAALASPVIKEMRADFHQMPAFTGGNAHFPMATVEVDPA